jgi:dTDP-4-amino-4,6-dideoxygalactose transaminase
MKIYEGQMLAINGGERIIKKPFAKYNSFGSEEVEAAKAVVESGVLSKFLGEWGADFYGGPKVKEFEKACEKYFKVKHAITVNSWTSGLVTAVGAIGIEPGDEVIVPPWTMCATATSILHWNAIPVFADIDEATFCISPESIEKNISKYTKAIISVDIAGHPAKFPLSIAPGA